MVATRPLRTVAAAALYLACGICPDEPGGNQNTNSANLFITTRGSLHCRHAHHTHSTTVCIPRRFINQAHIYDKAFMGILGIPLSSLMTLVVVCHFISTMNMKKINANPAALLSGRWKL